MEFRYFTDGESRISSRIVLSPTGEWEILYAKCPSGHLHLLGVYQHQRHILAATDWVHDRRAAKLVYEIAVKMGWRERERHKFILLGADPEFEAFDPLRGVTDDLPGSGFFGTDDGDVDEDGSQEIVELHPLPSAEPRTVYARIRSLAQEWERRTGYRACLAGHRFPIGFHIHVGVEDGCALTSSVETLDKFINAVDREIGWLVELSGRARGDYAKRCSWEPKWHGLEYRTLPASVLAFEELAVWTMRVVKAIARGNKVPAMSATARKQADQIREAERSGRPFTFGLQPLEMADRQHQVTLHRHDTFCAHWAKWAREMAGRPRASVLLFGFDRARGLVTNSPELAERFGWKYIPFRLEREEEIQIGLPYDVRVSFDQEVADFITNLILQEPERG
ncbi:hypothetical protein [Thermogutta sp.]|uniref:putative amidoligase domain-containing protein n=1 Tax=Thermogutta sp. TaxID=1962930 RepID=UPI0032200975